MTEHSAEHKYDKGLRATSAGHRAKKLCSTGLSFPLLELL